MSRRCLEQHMNRVTDTCIPEMEADAPDRAAVLAEWVAADQRGERLFPHEFMYRILRSGALTSAYQIDPAETVGWSRPRSGTCRCGFPGWEDSTLGNMLRLALHQRRRPHVHTVRTG